MIKTHGCRSDESPIRDVAVVTESCVPANRKASKIVTKDFGIVIVKLLLFAMPILV